MLKRTLGRLVLFFLFSHDGVAAEPAQLDVSWRPDPPYMRFTINSASSQDTSFTFGCTYSMPCSLKMHTQPGTREVWSYTFRNISGYNFTLKTFLAEVNKSLPLSSGFLGYKEGQCIDIGLDFMTYIASTCGGGINPPEVKPPVVTCALQNDIALRHGELAAANVDGHNANAYGMLSCTGAASVNIRVVDGSGSSMLKLAANGSLYSALKVNGVAGNAGVNVSVSGASTNKPVLFSSTLAAKGAVSSGNFSASALAIVSVN